MNNLQVLKNEPVIQPQSSISQEKKVQYKTNFKAIEDQFVRQTPVITQPPMLDQQAMMIRALEERKNKEARNQKIKSNIVTGVGVASGIAIIAMALKTMKGGGGGAGGAVDLGKQTSELRAIWEDISKALGIDDMALSKETKDLLDIVKKGINDPSSVKERGGKTVRSILLYGPPGTGKTTFAKALAKMFPDSEFASLDITSLGSEYHSVTERNLNAAVDMICEEAAANPKKRYFVFIDEIDSVMMQDEGKGAKLSNDILNEFKKCFTEKLGKHDNIITVGATNLEIDVEKAVAAGGKKLDKPMLDRFSQKILVDLPSKEQLIKSITSHYKNCKLVDDSLKQEGNETLAKVCEILSNKENSTSFRKLESFYDETASSINDSTTKVGIKDFIKTILKQQHDMKLTPDEVATLFAMVA